MLDTMPANERETWRSRLWRLLTAWEAALDTVSYPPRGFRCAMDCGASIWLTGLSP